MSKLIIKKSRKQEQQVADDLGGRRQPASGATWHSKGDVKTPDELVECKMTDKKSYAVTRETLEKLVMEAYRQNKEPVMQLQFTGPNGGRYALIPWDDYLRLRGQ